MLDKMIYFVIIINGEVGFFLFFFWGMGEYYIVFLNIKNWLGNNMYVLLKFLKIDLL